METANAPGHVEEELTVPVPAQAELLVYGLTDFATVASERLRGALEFRGHSVRERDGLWYSCCGTTCHESRAEAEKACVEGVADELAVESEEVRSW